MIVTAEMFNPPIQLLVSVRSREEAQVVKKTIKQAIKNSDQRSSILGIVDVKEPFAGALGMATVDCLNDISNVVGSDWAKSFAVGELNQWLERGATVSNPVRLSSELNAKLVTEYQYVKVGLSNISNSKYRENWPVQWREFFEGIPDETNPVVVAYFDFEYCGSPPPDELIEFASSETRCETILFDTFSKKQNLFEIHAPQTINRWIEKSKSLGLRTVLAGSVDSSCLDLAMQMAPDLIGVRGAICGGSRESELDPDKLDEILKRMEQFSQRVHPN
ncbi:MAG: (5-formylfuran-3-yl)methyl phosphate synthase [Mariniblastus sp.]